MVTDNLPVVPADSAFIAGFTAHALVTLLRGLSAESFVALMEPKHREACTRAIAAIERADHSWLIKSGYPVDDPSDSPTNGSPEVPTASLSAHSRHEVGT